jgi:DNA-binding MarR family transcriptional regulator
MAPSPQAQGFLENVTAFKRALRQGAASAYGEFSLGDTQMKVLRYVAKNPGVSQAALARATETDPALLGRALRSLLQRGELKRSRSKEDARAFVVDLGIKGHALAEQINAANQQLIERLLSPFDARDFTDFARIVEKLKRAFDGQLEPSVRIVSRSIRKRRK